MKYPIAYLLTWTTYGTWLHGDERGSFDRRGQFIQADTTLNRSLVQGLVDDIVLLTVDQRRVVEAAIDRLCAEQGWELHARSARSNHVHAVISAAIAGTKLRAGVKAACSRALSEMMGLENSRTKDGAKKWWTEKGNIEEIWSDRHLRTAVRYVKDQ